jgi:hypothetical protein
LLFSGRFEDRSASAVKADQRCVVFFRSSIWLTRIANGDQFQLLTVNHTKLPALTVPRQFDVKDAPAA